jgi:hypothetical protein
MVFMILVKWRKGVNLKRRFDILLHNYSRHLTFFLQIIYFNCCIHIYSKIGTYCIYVSLWANKINIALTKSHVFVSWTKTTIFGEIKIWLLIESDNNYQIQILKNHAIIRLSYCIIVWRFFNCYVSELNRIPHTCTVH